MTPDNRLDLRIDPALKARVKAAAEAEDRSLTRWVVRVLESALSASETPEAPRETQKRNGPRTINRDGTHRPTCKCPVCQPKAKR